jgi:predicted Zn-dependent protease with MMP-like domain
LPAGPVAAAPAEAGTSGGAAAGGGHRPPRIVVYRRPLMARADTDEDLGELVFEVVVEEFARLLGLDPEDVDPGYPADD